MSSFSVMENWEIRFLGWCQKRIFNTGILKIILENILEYTEI